MSLYTISVNLYLAGNCFCLTDFALQMVNVGINYGVRCFVAHMVRQASKKGVGRFIVQI